MAAGILCTQACDSIDDLSGGADAPEVTYPSTTFEADFYTAGQSSVPSIDWNGAQGTVSLGNVIEGLTVNSTTGQLQWTKMLPAGTHNLEVVLTNSEGQVVVPITLRNPLVGTFTGKFDENRYDFKLEFDRDGILLVEGDDLTATGTYEIEDGEFSAYYAYDDYPDFDYTLLGELEQTSSSVSIDGFYYAGVYKAGDSPRSDFNVTLE